MTASNLMCLRVLNNLNTALPLSPLYEPHPAGLSLSLPLHKPFLTPPRSVSHSLLPHALRVPPPPCFSLSLLSPISHYTMAGMINKVVAALLNSTGAEATIQEFLTSDSTSGRLKQRATSLLNNKELLRNVQGLIPEDQTNFVDKADQVCRDGPFFLNISPSSFPQRHIRLSTRKPQNL